MNFKSGLALCAALLLGACFSERDHFYTLRTLPEAGRANESAPTLHAVLGVTVPSIVDRSEMVVNTSDTAILVLDHERWILPLSDQVAETLARDIERRRSDVLIGDRGFDKASAPAVTIKVEIVRLSARQGESVSLEAHWRIVDSQAGLDQIGSSTFETPLRAGDYAAVALAYSQVLSELAQTLAQTLRP